MEMLRMIKEQRLEEVEKGLYDAIFSKYTKEHSYEEEDAETKDGFKSMSAYADSFYCSIVDASLDKIVAYPGEIPDEMWGLIVKAASDGDKTFFVNLMRTDVKLVKQEFLKFFNV